MTEVIRNIDKFKGCIEANYIDLTERKELQQHHFTIADKPYINSNTILVLAYPTKAHNYTWCNDKYCSKRERIIRFQLFEVFKIAHVNSLFYWRKQTLRKFWKVFDEDSWDLHQHMEAVA
jgi:hypothetical protein